MEQFVSPAKFLPTTNTNRILIAILVASVSLGVISGLVLARGETHSTTSSANIKTTAQVKNPSLDTKTFRDFAQGTVKKRPEPKDPSEYVEGTHLLVRDDNPTPVALTSSVVDLTKYEDKKVKVYGETQKAIKEGWLMDVGKVEQIK